MSEDLGRYGDSDRPEIRAFVPVDAKRILDVGCWRGAFGAALKQGAQREVWGIEIDEEVAEIARTRLDRVIVGEAVRAMHDLAGEYFDAITMNDVLEHLVRPDLALEMAKQLLNPQTGVIVAAIPNIRYFHEFMRIAVGKDFPMEDSGIFDRTHLHFYTKLSIRRLFEESGFSINHLVGVNPTMSRKFAWLNKLMLNKLEDMRWLQYVVVAKARD